MASPYEFSAKKVQTVGMCLICIFWGYFGTTCALAVISGYLIRDLISVLHSRIVMCFFFFFR